jgi:hypothetical protein
MPQLSTLEEVAKIVIRRTIADVGDGNALVSALEKAYPFPSDNYCRAIWDQVLDQHIHRGYAAELSARPFQSSSSR